MESNVMENAKIVKEIRLISCCLD